VNIPKRILLSFYLGLRLRRTGPVAAGGSRADGSVTHSPDSPLFERRTGLGGPTPLVRTGATRGATRPVSVEAVHKVEGIHE
jgi:hypothetical protein